MRRIRISGKLNIGDVFEVQIDSVSRGYFQYLADDTSQLKSHVVGAFRKTDGVGEEPVVSDIIKGEIGFYAHVFLNIGLKQKFWRKIGSGPAPRRVDVLFRDTNDYGNPSIVISKDWYVWEIGGPFKSVGQLRGDNQKAEIGIVVPPDSLVHRIRTGKYDFVYPEY